MAAEASPLVSFGLRAGGPAALARWLGFRGPAVPGFDWAIAAATALSVAAAFLASLAAICERVYTLNGLKLISVPFAFVTGLFEKWLFFASG